MRGQPQSRHGQCQEDDVDLFSHSGKQLAIAERGIVEPVGQLYARATTCLGFKLPKQG